MSGTFPKGRRGRRQGGFTLIEMLISLAIFAVVTAFVTANFRVGRQGDELRIASQLAASAVRRAQTAALAGQVVRWCDGGTNDRKLCPGGTDAECGGGICRRDTPSGFGVRFSTADGENRTSVMFADIDGDKRYDPGEDIRHDNVSSGPFVIVSAVDPAASDALDIVFTPPKPSVTYNAATTDVVATVTLRHTDTLQEKGVTVNAVSGQVSAE